MQTIQVKPNPHIFDPLEAFQTQDGQKILQLFKDGAVLKVWRYSLPATWWLEHDDGREYHWENNLKLRTAGTPDVWLLVRLAKQVSSEGITPGGKPGIESWVFDPEALEKAQADWDYAQECAKDWADHAGTFSGSMEALSPLAQSAVLTLRSKTQLPMRGELFTVLLELNTAGLLAVHPEGHATLKIPAKQLALPKGTPLKVIRIEPETSMPAAAGLH